MVKVPILGNHFVGKSSLFKKLNDSEQNNRYFEGNLFAMLKARTYFNLSFRFQLWDPQGISSYDSLGKWSCDNASIAIVMYDVSDITKDSYNEVINWSHQVWKSCERGAIPILILGNKIDVRKDNIPTLTLNECSETKKILSEESGYQIKQIEISVQTDLDIENIFSLLAEAYIQYNEL